MLPIRVTFRDVEQTDAIKTKIEKQAEKLKKFYSAIQSCNVAVVATQKHKHKGKLFSIRLDLGVSGGEIAINRVEDEDLYVAIRDAFAAAKRKLETHASQQRHDVKSHDEVYHGTVARKFPERGFGIIQTASGDEFYFQPVHVAHPTFDNLEVGMQVQFIPVYEGDGPKAHRISAGKHKLKVE